MWNIALYLAFLVWAVPAGGLFIYSNDLGGPWKTVVLTALVFSWLLIFPLHSLIVTGKQT